MQTRRKLAAAVATVFALLIWIMFPWSRNESNVKPTMSEEFSTSTGAQLIRPVGSSPYMPQRSTNRVRVVDLASRKPLANCTVGVEDGRLSDNSAVCAGTTDASGVAEVEIANTANGTFRVSLPHALGGREFVFEQSKTVMEDDIYQIEVPALAGLTFRIQTADPSPDGLGEVATDILSIPMLPSADLVGVKEHFRLAGLQGDPDIYRNALRNLKLLVEPDIHLSLKSVSDTVWMGVAGEVAISTYGVPYVPFRANVQTNYGTVTDVLINLRRKPFVRGRLLRMSGEPVPFHGVTVNCRAHFARGEFIPRAPSEPANPGFVTIVDPGSQSREVTAILSAKTDENGCFQIGFPFTDAVTAYAFVAGSKLALTTRKAGSRDAAVLDMLLIAESSVATDRMRLVDQEGRSLGQLDLEVAPECSVSDQFLIQYPKISTDADGYFDISWFERSHTYSISLYASADAARYRRLEGIAPLPQGTIIVERQK